MLHSRTTLLKTNISVTDKRSGLFQFCLPVPGSFRHQGLSQHPQPLPDLPGSGLDEDYLPHQQHVRSAVSEHTAHPSFNTQQSMVLLLEQRDRDSTQLGFLHRQPWQSSSLLCSFCGLRSPPRGTSETSATRARQPEERAKLPTSHHCQELGVTA